MPKPDQTRVREHREEAERLRQVDRDTQRQIVALHRSVADNPKVERRDRDLARERADALESLLRLTKKRPKKT
jgi:hypothetical protein